MDQTERIEPPSWYYAFAALFFILGVGGMIYSFASGIYRIRESMVRMDVPGQMDLELKHETYTVFLEFDARAAGQSPDSNVHCDVHVLPSGESIETTPPSARSTYSSGSRRGVTFLQFNAAHDATYTLACQTTGDAATLKPAVAVGGGTARGIRTMYIRSVVLLMVGLAVALLMFLWVATQRTKSGKEIRERGLRPV